MTHDDLYPCINCGRDNLYPGPCASCEHFIHPPEPSQPQRREDHMTPAERLTAMTSDLPQPITVGDLHRFAPDAAGRRRLSFQVAAGDRHLAEIAVIPSASEAPQAHLDTFASALHNLLAGSEQRVADAEYRAAGHCATIAHQRTEIEGLRAKLSDFEQGRSVRGEFYAIDGNGGVWLQGRPTSAAYGLWFKSWADLAHERPGLRPCGAKTGEHGDVYVVMRPIADLATVPA